MISFKKKIQSLIEQLPDEPVAMLEFDQLDKFSNVLATVLDKIALIYNAEALGKLDDFDLEYFINNLYQAFSIQHNWIEANQHLLSPEKLEENTHQLITRQNQQIKQLTEAMARAKARMPEILEQQKILQEENTHNAEEIKRFAEEEQRLNELLNNKDHLIQRKKDLEETRKAVEVGNLDNLQREVNELTQQFDTEDQKRQELLTNQQKYAAALQVAVNQVASLNHASNVLKQMKTQLDLHQEQLKKDYATQAEDLKIHVSFNEQHGGKASQSVAQKLQQVQQLLKEVDEDIKASLV